MGIFPIFKENLLHVHHILDKKLSKELRILNPILKIKMCEKKHNELKHLILTFFYTFRLHL